MGNNSVQKAIDTQVATPATPGGPMRSPAEDMRYRLKSIFFGSVGNLVEWYDWLVYSAFAIYFSKAFFPGGNQTAQLLNSAAIFAIGFLMRPIGGWLMGILADRHGRRMALVASVVLMSFGSLMIALTPGYASIGVMAPALLVVARLLQGLSLGGEYGTSAVYLSEMATSKHRGFYSSFQYVTMIAGQLIALGVMIVLQHTLSKGQLNAWGWRIPFVIGAGLALLAFVLRRGMDETESFVHKQKGQPRENLLRVLLRYPRPILTVMALTVGGTVSFYTYTTYIQKFLVNTSGFSKDTATLITAGAQFVFMLLNPVMGAISDKVGRKPVLIGFGIFGTLCTAPILLAISHAHSIAPAFLLVLLGMVITSGYTSINAVVKAELFPVEIRALGVGLPYAITVSIFGGTTEFVALYCKSIGHESWYYAYVSALVFCSLLVYVTMRDTKKYSQIDRD